MLRITNRGYYIVVICVKNNILVGFIHYLI